MHDLWRTYHAPHGSISGTFDTRAHMSEVPDMLTVEEAATILRVGRTTGYELANRWLDSGGEEGLPVIHVGRLLRVPTVLFEERFRLKVTRVSSGRFVVKLQEAQGPTGDPPDVHEPRAKPTPRQRRTVGNQSALPFAG